MLLLLLMSTDVLQIKTTPHLYFINYSGLKLTSFMPSILFLGFLTCTDLWGHGGGGGGLRLNSGRNVKSQVF